MTDAPYSYGIDAETGGYLIAPPPPDQLTKALLAGRSAASPSYSEDHSFDLVDEAFAEDLGSAGWGVIFAAGTDPAIRQALEPLLERRREQATRVFRGGYREFELPPATSGPALTPEQFLRGHGAATDGPVDPAEMPYNLLLVGGPEEIGFGFQYGLDVQHSVGRLCFDRPADYAAYARAVLAAEDGRRPRGSRATVFAVRNEDDLASALGESDLAVPVLDYLRKSFPALEIEAILGEEATRSRLERVLGSDPPAFLFTSGHGLARKNTHPGQRDEQGAIVCRDWPGRVLWDKAPVPGHYFAADDLASDVDLTGLVAFCFACFSAGTPAEDDFATLVPNWPAVAPRPFVSRLAQRMLAQGALAVIGHVDRVWLHSFYLRDSGIRETRTFEQTLGRILRGVPVGHALDVLNRRWGGLSSRLSTLLYRRRRGEAVPDEEISNAFLACNDARNYILLGDPAVRAF